MNVPRTLARSGALLCVLSAAACDRTPLDTVRPPVDPEPSAPAALGRMDCAVTVGTGVMACTSPDPGTGAASGLIVGGPNGTYVQLTASGHTYTAADSVFSIDVTIQNLIYQALGTTNGTSADPSGVRIVFVNEPVASVMNPPAAPPEPVDLINEQRGFITAADQAYFQYAGLLQTSGTSEAVEWRFKLPPAVQRFTFSVIVSAAVQHPSGVVQVTPGADTMTAGQNVSLTRRVVDAVGNSVADQSVTWSSSDEAIATVNGSGVVTGVAPGTVTITATQGARTGSATVAVCPSLALGAVYTADMPAGSSLCLGGGAEYVVMPVNTSQAAGVSLSLTGAGITSVDTTTGPRPALLPGGRGGIAVPGLRRDDAWEWRLRQMERASLPRGLSPAPGAGGPRMAITPGVPSVGVLMTLNVRTSSACSNPDNRTGRVMAVGTRIIVLADTTNPASGLTASQYQAIADTFDALVWPTLTGTFGAPSDIDGNGRVVAFYTRAVNELTPPGSGSYVGGFFFSRDLRSAASCPTSNVGEMFYMLAADSAGTVNGNVRTRSFVMQVTMGTLAHEFEHLINASRRMHVNTPWNNQLEETWLDEGLAHVSEELTFYAASGLSPGNNYDATDLFVGPPLTYFFRYAEANYGRLRQWLLSPETSGGFQNDDDLSTRGAAWAFLRYASDRSPATDAAFFSALVNTQNRGMANLQAVLGTDPLPWYRDFTAALYGDDAGIGTAAPYTHPSWNFRDVYSNLDYDPSGDCTCRYELKVRDPANGVAQTFTYAAGGGISYARMRVPPSASAGVTVLSGGVAPAATVRLSVIRRK